MSHIQSSAMMMTNTRGCAFGCDSHYDFYRVTEHSSVFSLFLIFICISSQIHALSMCVKLIIVFYSTLISTVKPPSHSILFLLHLFFVMNLHSHSHLHLKPKVKWLPRIVVGSATTWHLCLRLCSQHMVMLVLRSSHFLSLQTAPNDIWCVQTDAIRYSTQNSVWLVTD